MCGKLLRKFIGLWENHGGPAVDLWWPSGRLWGSIEGACSGPTVGGRSKGSRLSKRQTYYRMPTVEQTPEAGGQARRVASQPPARPARSLVG